MSKSFGYKLPGFFMEYGPIVAESEEGVRAEIRKRMGVKRLPWGLQIWDVMDRPITQWRIDQAS